MKAPTQEQRLEKGCGNRNSSKLSNQFHSDSNGRLVLNELAKKWGGVGCADKPNEALRPSDL